MASISNDPGGRRRILFQGTDGKRKCIRLGKVNQRHAETVKLRIELLLAARITGAAPDDETSLWLAKRDDAFHAKLAKAGLTPRRGTGGQTELASFLDGYIAGRSDVKPNTAAHLKRARGNLVAYFGADKPLAEITPGDADDFRLYLLLTMGDNTVRRICGRAKQFLRAAERKRLIAASPFADMRGTNVQANRAREWFITRDVANKVLAACIDAEWRLIFALARYGGLRTPSETLALRWGDIHWDSGRMTVRSSKTEHHAGKATRTIPIFPELLPELEAVFDQAPEGTEFVINRYRDARQNLRTQFERIIRAAGFEPWPKLFQNLRATRETELAGEFPIHVVCEWIGNSQAIAAKHYLQVTDAHFEAAQKAAQSAVAKSDSGCQQSGNDSKTSENSPADNPRHTYTTV